MKVPFLDLRKINQSLEPRLLESFSQILDSGWFVQGGALESFEADFADYCGVSHCVGVGNGLDAIHLLLTAYGIGAGDEVIVPSNTFIATWLAVTRCGATPVPVEPDPYTHNLSPEGLRAAITPRSAAVIPVHLYGQPADMDAINEIAINHGLLVIEDAAQAQGASYKQRKVGSLGNAAATSFYPGKNLGALGDGGAILTSDSHIAEIVRSLRNYGSTIKYQHDLLGYNTRLDELQAAFLQAKLKHLDHANSERRRVAGRYTEELHEVAEQLQLQLPHVPDWATPVWHLYVIRSEERDRLQAHLQRNGVETAIHYPTPPHKQMCYRNTRFPPLPLAEQLASEVLSLPMSPVLSADEVAHVIRVLRTFVPNPRSLA